ncbi:MAG: secretion protein, partial [Rhodobacteraceae bacterium]|nr:secretion protein [Paracoccaceae bacterium]
TVQLPTIDQRAIQNDSVLTPGETLVLSGYEQEVATRSNSGTGAARFLGLGGSAKGSTRKIRMIVLVRPTIMPVGDIP